jgi:hypothetical protein
LDWHLPLSRRQHVLALVLHAACERARRRGALRILSRRRADAVSGRFLHRPSSPSRPARGHRAASRSALAARRRWRSPVALTFAVATRPGARVFAATFRYDHQGNASVRDEQRPSPPHRGRTAIRLGGSYCDHRVAGSPTRSPYDVRWPGHARCLDLATPRARSQLCSSSLAFPFLVAGPRRAGGGGDGSDPYRYCARGGVRVAEIPVPPRRS